MNCNDEDKQAIVQFIKDSLKPISSGEAIASKGITSKRGYLRKWFVDILEGNVPLITIDCRYSTIIKWHYTQGVSWRAISVITQTPTTTLRANCDLILSIVVDHMMRAQQLSILKIIRETTSVRYKGNDE